MKKYDCECPICGWLNKNLYLEETNGWMECEHCSSVVQVVRYINLRKVPVITMGTKPSTLIREAVGCT